MLILREFGFEKKCFVTFTGVHNGEAAILVQTVFRVCLEILELLPGLHCTGPHDAAINSNFPSDIINHF
jgi:hypothetical protein